MKLSERIEALDRLGDLIRTTQGYVFDPVIGRAIGENGWFTRSSILQALEFVSNHYLVHENLTSWTDGYQIQSDNSINVGLIPTGQIPLDGIHDLICVFVSGSKATIKLSEKDKVLFEHFIRLLYDLNPDTQQYFETVEVLRGIDAVISRSIGGHAGHFEHYFSKYPNIIRKKLYSCAVITGNESPEDLNKLGRDVFDYFGLSSRNISKLFVPRDYKMDRFFESIVLFDHVIDHHKYKNNYDYAYSIYLLGQHPFLTNNFLILREDPTLSSRISCLHYEFYDDLDHLDNMLQTQEDHLQSVASQVPIGHIPVVPFGECLTPPITAYEDGIDTLDFLTGLAYKES